jgi:hypothetical protein
MPFARRGGIAADESIQTAAVPRRRRCVDRVGEMTTAESRPDLEG